MNDLIEKYKLTLPAREYQVLAMRFGVNSGEKMTLQEVGRVLGVTRERVRQIEAKGLERIKWWEYDANGGQLPERLQRCHHCNFPKCLSCWDKGYATTIQYATSSQDFSDDPPPRTTRLPLMRLCHCERGKQLREILEKAPSMTQAFF